MKVSNHKYTKIGQFEECTTASNTCLGRLEMSGKDALKAHEQLSLTDQSATMGTLLDDMDCKIFLDSDATRSFMKSSIILENKSLHSLYKFSSKVKLFKLEMGQLLTSCSLFLLS